MRGYVLIATHIFRQKCVCSFKTIDVDIHTSIIVFNVCKKLIWGLDSDFDLDLDSDLGGDSDRDLDVDLVRVS